MSVNHCLYSLEAELKQKAVRQLQDGGEKDAISKLRLMCFSNGVTGILNLARHCRGNDKDQDKALTQEDFVHGVTAAGLNVSEEEAKDIFRAFDAQGNGSVDVSEFLDKLRPTMPQCRIDIINSAFQKIDSDKDGKINAKDLKSVYSVREHPKYLSGEKSHDEIINEFWSKFDVGKGSNADNAITQEEFMNYYASISATIDNDMYFDLMMRRTYAL